MKRQDPSDDPDAPDSNGDEGQPAEYETEASATPTAEAEAAPSPVDPKLAGRARHKICSPQLLHLDLAGNPLWFNGGLVRNKFVDRREWKFGAWDTYMAEPRDVREPGAWFLGEANMCCLTSDEGLKAPLSARDMALMEAMVDQARKVGIAH